MFGSYMFKLFVLLLLLCNSYVASSTISSPESSRSIPESLERVGLGVMTSVLTLSEEVDTKKCQLDFIKSTAIMEYIQGLQTKVGESDRVVALPDSTTIAELQSILPLLLLLIDKQKESGSKEQKGYWGKLIISAIPDLKRYILSEDSEFLFQSSVIDGMKKYILLDDPILLVKRDGGLVKDFMKKYP